MLNDFSRYIIAWKLFTTMAATDVKELLDRAVEKTGIHEIPVRHRLRLLSDSGPAHVSGKLIVYLASKGMTQRHGAPFHLMTWRGIELYHRSRKDEISLWKYYLPWELEQETKQFVDYYHYHGERYREPLNNVTPADGHYGRQLEILLRGERLRRRTLETRKPHNLLKSIARSTYWQNWECVRLTLKASTIRFENHIHQYTISVPQG